MSENQSDQGVARVRSLDTATLSDALDRLGIAGQCQGIAPRDPQFRLIGRAFTLLYGPAGKPPGTVGDYIDDVPEVDPATYRLHVDGLANGKRVWTPDGLRALP